MSRYFKDLSLLLVYFPYRWFVQTLPFQISYHIATLLGNIQYLLLPSRQKRRFIANLDLIFGNKLDYREKKTTLRRFFINRQKEFVDLCIMGRKDYEKYLRACSEEGISYMDQVLSKRKGLVGLNFHFGSVILTSPYMVYKGYKITPVLALPAYINGVSHWVSQRVLGIKYTILRERGNFQIITSSGSPPSLAETQYRCLSHNHVISAAGDGPLGKKFTLVDFFNVKLKVSLGPAIISTKSGADIVPSFAIRRKDNFQHFVFKEPIRVEGEDEETLNKVVQRYFKYLEYYISQYPDQWIYWMRMEVEGVENGIPTVWLHYQFFEAETNQPASTTKLEEEKKA